MKVIDGDVEVLLWVKLVVCRDAYALADFPALEARMASIK